MSIQEYELMDRFGDRHGQIFISGIDALVRLPLEQAKRDRDAGLKTAGFISGYRGSPLGAYDMALSKAAGLLEASNIKFQPGVNEDLAATAVWGTQQVPLMEGARCDGVFSIWYGKGPGVDRSVDALKHGNFTGASALGGVLVVAGDDPGAKSSSLPHQSEQALISAGIPVLAPADAHEILHFGLIGWAISRSTGSWVALRLPTDILDSSGTVRVDDLPDVVLQERVAPRPIEWITPPLEQERQVFEDRLPAVRECVRINQLDTIPIRAKTARRGIVTVGKTYLDVREAMEQLDLTESEIEGLGLTLYKVALVWPIESIRLREWATGLDEILVVEEKRSLIEDQLAVALYDLPSRPKILGKNSNMGKPLFSEVGELSPVTIRARLATWLALDQQVRTPAKRGIVPLSLTPVAAPLERRAAFCSGCPHNASTVVPEGSVALGGIGCHGMAAWMPERKTLAMTHMGAEGANWIGISPFTDTEHIFQNMGDGTYFHSGHLAIRAAVAAGANITYKVLANGVTAMTGGQVIEGEEIQSEIIVPDIVRQLLAERVSPVIVVTDDVSRYGRGDLPDGVDLVDRSELDPVQRRLRGERGVSALVYDQTCAAEARRHRKRGTLPTPTKRVIINELVCEGCGDCSVQSNCIAIEPLETDFGRKREINQHSCNLDLSCLKGYCPSFVTVDGGKIRSGVEAKDAGNLIGSLPTPATADTSKPYNIFIAGIGGTGVVTIGALVAMAAHLEGKSATVLDVTGLAQKNGAVASHIRVAGASLPVYTRRIGPEGSDLVLGCDLVVAAGDVSLATMRSGRTTAVLNTEVAPTADFIRQPDLDLSSSSMVETIRRTIGESATQTLDAGSLATALVGDAMATNLFLIGYALQRGLLPVGLGSLERAIELNGVAVEMNKLALLWGRLAAHDLDAVHEALNSTTRPADVGSDLDSLVSRRVDFLRDYQNDKYAHRYRQLIELARRHEQRVTDRHEFSEAVARYLFKVMAYKDEYEVARLYTDGSFKRQVEETFEGDYSLKVNLAPQMLFPKDPSTGRPRKVAFGPAIFPALRVLASLRFLRGTRLDPFGQTAHRRRERQVVVDYTDSIRRVLPLLSEDSYDLAVELARLPEHIRGFAEIKDESIEDVAGRAEKLWERWEATVAADSGRVG